MKRPHGLENAPVVGEEEEEEEAVVDPIPLHQESLQHSSAALQEEEVD